MTTQAHKDKPRLQKSRTIEALSKAEAAAYHHQKSFPAQDKERFLL